jgi:hypothetical protein
LFRQKRFGVDRNYSYDLYRTYCSHSNRAPEKFGKQRIGDTRNSDENRASGFIKDVIHCLFDNFWVLFVAHTLVASP